MEFRSSDDLTTVETATENIYLVDKQQSALFESRSALLRELVIAASKEAQDAHFLSDTMREVYDTVCKCVNNERDLDKYFSPNTVKFFFDSISVADKLEVCRAIGKSLKLPKNPLKLLLSTDGTNQSDLADETATGRVAYMRNNYTESAFLKFSKVLANARSAYFQSFDAVCEEVYSGGCEFCILPLESSSDGRLNSFYTMIDRFELKIAAVCDIEHHDSQRFTRFALLKKSLEEVSELRYSAKKQIFEFRFTSAIGGQSPISDILRAAEGCGLSLLRLASLPLPYNDEMLSYYVSFTLDGADTLTFLTYITLEFPQCDPLGVYFTVK